MQKFLTIRSTAVETGLPEHFIRKLVKQGTIPCIYSGNRALIQIDRISKVLEDMQTNEQMQSCTDFRRVEA